MSCGCRRYSRITIIGICTLLGPLLSIISLYVAGAIIRVVGGWLGGKATSAEVRAALAWSSVPQIVVLILRVPGLVLFGNEMFSRAKPVIMGDPAPRYFLVAVLLIDLFLLVWSLILGFFCLAEVLRIGIVRILATLGLTAAAFVGIVLAVLYPFLSKTTLSSPQPRPSPIVAPVVRRAPTPREAPIERRSVRPPAEFGPVVAAIWEDGLKVKAEVDRDLPDHPVIKLAIDSDRERVNDDVLQHLRDLPALRSLTIGHGQVSDSGMRYLRGLTDLQSLTINWANITDAGLENLSGMTELRTLGLGACENVTGSGLGFLRGARGLRVLNLSFSGITNEGLAFVRRLAPLTELNIGGMHLDDSSLVHLRGMQSLEKLELGWTNPIEGPGLVNLEDLTHLRFLGLANDPVTDEAIDHLARLESLENLNIDSTQITRDGFNRLSKALPRTRINSEFARPDRKPRPAPAKVSRNPRPKKPPESPLRKDAAPQP
jgi:hypothetical protein